jgi:outer membrane protein OmpA-like peptidoglycan-associated protein
MKISAMKATIVALLLWGTGISASAMNYVVIGAFAKKSNAERLKKLEKNSTVDINPAKQLYYVYVFTTEDHEAALTEARRLQSQTRYKDAWVFLGKLGPGGGGQDIIVKKQEPVKETVVEKPVETPAIVEPQEPKENKTDVANDPKASLKDFFFSVTREDGGQTVDGAEITVLDPQTQHKQNVFKGNEDVTMKSFNQSGDVRLECDVAGYRKIVQTINFKDPSSSEGGVTIEDNRIIVPFKLVRLKKGDKSILYNVFFFKDAGIMRPESKYELDGLLAMMNENPKYKIKIHGHTNGNAAGKILEVGDAGDFFTLTGAKEGRGSAKKLSFVRAEVIKNYLVKEGIDAGRMTTKAWGGKKPIYDKNATQASGNVRVEVEVIED